MIGAILVPLFASLAGKVLERLFDSGSKALKAATPGPAPSTASGNGTQFSALLQSGLAGRTVQPVAAPGAGAGTVPGVSLGADDRDRALSMGGPLWRAWYEPRLAASRYNDIQAV